MKRRREYQAGSAQPFHGPPIDYRLTPQYRRPALLRFIMLAVLTIVCAVAPLVLLKAGAFVFGALALFFGVSYLWRGRFRTRVTSRGIEIHGYFNHFVPWDQVRDIEVTAFGSDRMGLGEQFGTTQYARASVQGLASDKLPAVGRGMSRLASISVVRSDGRTVMLRAPLVSGWAPDPDFDDKARELEQLCTRYARGAIA